jgi:nitrite reductase/ring-hydroxylating ferredoxin subunit
LLLLDFKHKMIKPALVKLKLEQIPENGAMLVEIWPNDEYVPVIIIRRESSIYAYFNRCPHANWPLDTPDGEFLFSLDDDLICAGHGASFDVSNGRCMGGPGRGHPLKPYPFVKDGDYIIIGTKE